MFTRMSRVHTYESCVSATYPILSGLEATCMMVLTIVPYIMSCMCLQSSSPNNRSFTEFFFKILKSGATYISGKDKKLLYSQ